ncbi:uncharacterized protein [Miscanthus floridulus]|uniref:uncharacterized protein isoform X3 n=1 Tax=Miscanthus floridulus TaxID=154761 RepID=UPI00345905B1
MAACPLVPASSCRKSLASVPESDKHERRVHRSSAGERRLTLPAELQETDPPPSIPAPLRRKLDGGKTKESCRRNCIRAAVKEELKDGPTCIPTLQVPTSRPQKAVVLSMEEPSKLISTSGAIQDKDKIWKELIDFDTGRSNVFMAKTVDSSSFFEGFMWAAQGANMSTLNCRCNRFTKLSILEVLELCICRLYGILRSHLGL